MQPADVHAHRERRTTPSPRRTHVLDRLGTTRRKPEGRTPVTALDDLFGLNRQAWQDQAACRDTDNPDLFFAEHPGANKSTYEAKKICRECPVRIDCLEYAITNNERYGIWGGVSPGAMKVHRRLNPRLRHAQICSAGHDLTEVGTRSDGYCLECHYQNQRRSRRRRRGRGVA
jgi:WhiB family redox-sensing transcriptional regulator